MPWNTPPILTATPRATGYARLLRRTLTEPERRLWWHLRHRLPIDRSHFRRQVALGPYVADFCCLAQRLIIEVDGGQHGRDSDAAYDARRTARLERDGFKILRLGNAELMRSIEAVLDTIFAALSVTNTASGPTPTSNSSPQGGGEHAAEP